MTKKNRKELIRYKENPFIEDLEISVKNKNVRISNIGHKDNIAIVDIETGQKQGTYIGTKKQVDDEQFLKLFTGNIALTFDLKSAGIKAFNVVCWVMQSAAIQKDKIFIDKYVMEDFNEVHNKKLSKAVLYRGLTELINNKIIARYQRDGDYFINPAFVFNGDRLIFTTVIEKIKSEKQAQNEEQEQPPVDFEEDNQVVKSGNTNENFPFTSNKKAS